MEELQIYWRAEDPARNIARAYHLSVSHDLFGWICVETRWGRIGCTGQSQRRAFPEEQEARRYIRSIMRKRATAPARIGTAYRIVEGSENQINI
ncbi:WGR domain-containing protein [Altericroceibacterium spongiae]|uniref:WGR domain-containing protein n=2 Tax=Altericroceibacterium spongiae TaxID=2320269 RepID=A0A420EE52_9SPHN|nr:WGR domain-containing protein [Altericroceibacterium spongiae]